MNTQRPAIADIKAAMAWWHSLPESRRCAIASTTRCRAADEIARYWLANGGPLGLLQ